jgi:hypothetical protein
LVSYLGKEHTLVVFENRVLRGIFVPRGRNRRLEKMIQ